jgi:hypothetical protein
MGRPLTDYASYPGTNHSQSVINLLPPHHNKIQQNFVQPKTCLSAWPSGLCRAPSCFTAHELDGSRVQTPGADTVNQAVHPSGIGKLVAISMQWVTAVEGCEGKKRAAVRWLAYGLCSRRCKLPAVRTGL